MFNTRDIASINYGKTATAHTVNAAAARIYVYFRMDIMDCNYVTCTNQ